MTRCLLCNCWVNVTLPHTCPATGLPTLPPRPIVTFGPPVLPRPARAEYIEALEQAGASASLVRALTSRLTT